MDLLKKGQCLSHEDLSQETTSLCDQALTFLNKSIGEKCMQEFTGVPDVGFDDI